MLSLIQDLTVFSLCHLIITVLDLPWNASDIVTLGDGSETLFDLYSVTILWDGQYRETTVMHKQLNENFHNDEYPTTRRPATPNLANRQ